jgi:arabinogalactan endo-1,4-beta-galactosidase
MLNISHSNKKTGFAFFLAAILIAISCSFCTDESTDFITKSSDTNFYFGADLSAVNMVEDYGASFKDSSLTKDPFVLFKSHGCNVVRVRLFHNPEATGGYNQYNKPGYCGLADVTKTIRRAKEAGMKVCLDLHYSDTWADPKNQIIPLAWQGLSLDVLSDSVYNYTSWILTYLGKNNLTPELIQIGNEIDPGMLLPLGKDTNALAQLLNKGIKAVRDFSIHSTIKPKIIIHYADNAGITDKVQSLVNSGVTDFDIIGISYYDQWATITFDKLSSIIRTTKAKFSKDVMLVETSYQWTNISSDGETHNTQIAFNGYPVTPQGQYNYMKSLTQHIISGGGCGIIYWEPAWLKSTLGRGEETISFFDFNGNSLPAIKFMNASYQY